MEKDSVKLPKYLYKYRTVDKEGYTKGLIVKGEAYFASPATFNDPFDSWANMKFDPTLKEFKGLYSELAQHRSQAEADQMREQWQDPQKRMEYEQKIQGLNDRLHKVMGVFCLTEANDDILMWSHYSDCHKGICVRFDTSLLAKKIQDRIFKVRYQPELPQCDISKFDNSMTDHLLIKAKQWEYEQEWRALLKLAPVYVFPRRVISGIILGCKITTEQADEVRSWIANLRPKPSLYRAVRKRHEYGLDIIPTK